MGHLLHEAKEAFLSDAGRFLMHRVVDFKQKFGVADLSLLLVQVGFYLLLEIFEFVFLALRFEKLPKVANYGISD